MIRYLFILMILAYQINPIFSQVKTNLPSKKMKALIIDGQNNHAIWPKTTMMMKGYLEDTGLFDVDIERTKYTWQGPHYNKRTLKMDDVTDLLSMYSPNKAFNSVILSLLDDLYSWLALYIHVLVRESHIAHRRSL